MPPSPTQNGLGFHPEINTQHSSKEFYDDTSNEEDDA